MTNVEYFNSVANQWDVLRQGFFPETIRDTAFEKADLKPHQLAADLGAGTGFITEGLLRRQLRVIAVDHSDAMLAQLKTKFSAYKTLEIQKGEAMSLPIQDSGVDAVFCNMFLHHVDSPKDAIKEMYRITKPGGKVIITDLDQHDFKFLETEHFDKWAGFERFDIRRWLTDSGFQSVSVDCVNANCKADSANGNTKAEISVFIACGVKTQNTSE